LAAPSVGKVNLSLQKSLQTKARANILVSFADGTASALNQVSSRRFSSRGEQATAVYNALNAQAAISQKSVLEMLNSPRVFATKVQSFWISNQIFVEGADKNLIDSLASMDEISLIEEDQIIRLEEPKIADPSDVTILAEWGVDKIQSQQAWAIAGTGVGAIVGIIDTGARHTHEAIRDNFVGGTHAWYDPYGQVPNPTDGHGHGTHVTGTIAGILGLGVAPGAKWISCKGFTDSGSATTAGLIACGQFMACPHTYNGGSPDCTLAPHAVSNSWTLGASSGYDQVLTAWINANIIPVFANGNNGPTCSTTGYPAGSHLSISVGATTNTDAIASFSSRGPSSQGGGQAPDISAPGNAIVSAGIASDTARTTMSGTSMACPHAAGLVALLKSINPNANFTTIKNILESSADRNLVSSGQACAGIPDTSFPNYAFGFVRINALKAVQAIKT